MGTIAKYKTPAGREGYIARDSWSDPVTGDRQYRKARFARNAGRNLKQCEEEAKAWLAQREADRSRGVIFEPSREPLGDAIDRWIAELAPPSRSWATILCYRRAAKFRFDAVRDVPLAELTTARIRRLVESWRRDTLSRSAMRHGLVVLRGTLADAVESGKLLRSPIEGIRLPGGDPAPEITTWTPEQVRAFLRGRRDANDPDRALWELIFGGLLRVGELAALRWDDIDLDAGIVAVRRTWTWGEHGRPVIGDAPKSDAGARLVPIDPSLVALLRQDRAARPDVDMLVCAGARPHELRARFLRAVDASGLPRITPHGARHSGATALIAAGAPVTVVQRILGHSKPTMTMQYYVHHDEEELRGAVDTLAALYRGDMTLSSAQSAPKVVPITKQKESSG